MYYGSALHCQTSSPVLKNVLMATNQTMYNTSSSVFNCANQSNPELINVTIADNMGEQCTALSLSLCDSTRLTNCVLYNNPIGEMHLENMLGDCKIMYSNIQGGESGIIIDSISKLLWLDGNIDSDPQFTNSGFHPFSLSANSPCIDAGTPDTSGLSLPMFDLQHNQRILDGNNDGLEVVDMGAYEYRADTVNIKKLPSFPDASLHQMEIFPNPSSGNFSVEFTLRKPEFIRCSLFSMDGVLLRQTSEKPYVSGRHTISVQYPELKSGTYILRVTNAAGSSIQDLIIIR